MKYAITGHTRGIGNELFKQLSPDIIGFSKTTGYDICQNTDRQQIIDESYECDVFINNAHNGYYQTEMLYEMFDAWKDMDKLIINIGSDTTCGIKNKAWKYSAEKAALDKANEQLGFLKKSCKVTMVRFGFVGTPRIIEHFNPKTFITLEDSVKIIICQLPWMKKYRLLDFTITS
jgi:short-subunit dehydrogenase